MPWRAPSAIVVDTFSAASARRTPYVVWIAEALDAGVAGALAGAGALAASGVLAGAALDAGVAGAALCPALG
jgi:hypothetical protein